MSQQNAYETLGLTEASSFDEIQEARSRLVDACGDDRKQIEAIETAYDAILMERLRLRQEGKIKVPDRIRFPEKLAEAAAEQVPSLPKASSPEWLQGVMDSPSRAELLWPSVTFLALAALGVYAPPTGLALGVACSVYFLNRKERKFWRSVLLTLGGLVVGLGAGLLLGGLLIPQGAQFDWATPEVIATVVTFLVLWLTSSFLR